jgi:hypothetical protein
MFPSQLYSVNCNEEQLMKHHVRYKANVELNLEYK